jgi:hypothetical protein
MLFFGKPDPLLELEHLSATLSLNELREIFASLLDHYREVSSVKGWIPPMYPIDMHYSLKALGA